MKLRSLSRKALHSHLGLLAIGERELAAETIEGVREAERRRLYYDYDMPSLFAYLTKDRGFANGTAQRYIDAARLYAVVPTLREDIARGDLNMSQVTVVAKTVRQKKREEPKFKFEANQATTIFERIKGENAHSSQQILAQELKVEIKEEEVARAQADGSVRRAITLSREQEQALQRVKELISHTHPSPSFAELFNYLAQEFLKRKDPLVAKGRAKNKTEGDPPKFNEAAMDDRQDERSARQSVRAQKVETVEDQMAKEHDREETEFLVEDDEVVGSKVGRVDGRAKKTGLEVRKSEGRVESSAKTDAKPPTHYHMEVNPAPSSEWQCWPRLASRTYTPVETVRLVYRRDQSCRWKNENTGEVCGSKFQLQCDHRQSLWAGGSDEPENLQQGEWITQESPDFRVP